VDDCIKRWLLSVRPTRQLELQADLKYFLPRSVRYSVIADSRRSCRSSHTFYRAINYVLHIED